MPTSPPPSGPAMDRWCAEWLGWESPSDFFVDEDGTRLLACPGPLLGFAEWSPSTNLNDWQRDMLPKVLKDLHLSHLFAIELNAIMNPDSELRFLTEAHWTDHAKSTAGKRAEALWRAVNQ